jgi:NTP pyrophosphatase (non-canonical NTP hydrolase)
MQPDEIQKRALLTWYPEGHPLHDDRLHPVLALTGEAGELANLHKKVLYKPEFHADDLDYIEELGDCLYYLAILAYQFGLTIDELSLINREKLAGGKHGWPENGEYEESK